MLDTADGKRELRNDIVIVCAGGVVPTGFPKSAGIEIQQACGRRMR